MTEAPLSYWDFLRAAFGRKVKVPLLGEMPLNTMLIGVAGVAGLANPGFWLLGAAGELLYLFLKATNPRFQKLLRGDQLLRQQQKWAEKLHSAVQRLQPAAQERYRRLLEQCKLILGISETLHPDSLGDFRDLRGPSLNQLLSIFLRLLVSQEVMAQNLRHLDRSELEEGIARLKERLASATGGSPLERSLRGTLEIQTRRLDNLGRATDSLEVIAAELERIEQQVELIREEAAVSGSPEVLSARLDAVATAVSETSRWMDDQASLFGALSADSGVAMPELPDLPRLAEEQ